MRHGLTLSKEIWTIGEVRWAAAQVLAQTVDETGQRLAHSDTPDKNIILYILLLIVAIVLPFIVLARTMRQ